MHIINEAKHLFHRFHTERDTRSKSHFMNQEGLNSRWHREQVKGIIKAVVVDTRASILLICFLEAKLTKLSHFHSY